MNALIPLPRDIAHVADLLDQTGVIVTITKPSGIALVANGDLSDIRGLSLSMEPATPNMTALFGTPTSDLVPVISLPGGPTITRLPEAARDSRAGAHLRSVLHAAANLGPERLSGDSAIELSGGWELANASPLLVTAADDTAKVFLLWQKRSECDFANSASYMGSKRTLLPFLMQSLKEWIPDGSVFLDLMCGSGSVAGAAAHLWPTMASDAQGFCTVLAAIQSGGYTSSRAMEVLDALQDPISQNLNWLTEQLSEILSTEEDLFHSPESPYVSAHEYSQFIESLPTYPRGGRSGKWDPVAEVRSRQGVSPDRMPSCLFTAYYSDLYVGVRQAVEIDSLRHAISTLPDPVDRQWALGALIVATSRVATSYGGHFAQPFATPKRLTDSGLFTRVVAQRTMSVLLEFEKRLLTLARESESISYAVNIVEGPWHSALNQAAKDYPEADLAVYIDAPYRRDEYSRYYHLLETLVRYDYPPVKSPARVPDKKLGHRFASEFFTRDRVRMTRALADVIGEVLSRGWRCAWSYADNADASVGEVLATLSNPPSRVRSISADHAYSWQGRHDRNQTGPKRVRELLIMMDP